MTTLSYILLAVIPVMAIATITFASYKQRAKGHSAKKVVFSNILAFGIVFAVACTLTISASAADDTQTESASTSQSEESSASMSKAVQNGLALVGAGLSTGLAGIGGGVAVGNGASAAIAATTEDPKSFGKSLIFVALGESIALYGVVISILIMNKMV